MVHLGNPSIDFEFLVLVALSRCTPPTPHEPDDTPDDAADSSAGTPHHAAGTSHLEEEPQAGIQ